MANASDAFTYTTDADLTGQGAAGSGWNEAWQLAAASNTLVVRTGGQAGNAANASAANADYGNDRDLSAGVSNGHGSFYGKNITNGNSGNTALEFRATDGTTRFILRMRRSGLDSKCHLVGATTDSTTMGTWTDDTWHLFEYEFGTDGTLSGSAPGTNNVKMRKDGGSWTSVIGFSNNGTVANIYPSYNGGGGGVAGGIDTFDLVDADAGGGGSRIPLKTLLGVGT